MAPPEELSPASSILYYYTTLLHPVQRPGEALHPKLGVVRPDLTELDEGTNCGHNIRMPGLLSSDPTSTQTTCSCSAYSLFINRGAKLPASAVPTRWAKM